METKVQIINGYLHFDGEDASRDLASLYAAGRLSEEEYMNRWEAYTRAAITTL